MGRNRILLGVVALGAVVLVGAVVLGSSGFSSGSLSREATVEVVADDTGFVGLHDGHPGGGFVSQGADGVLTIDFTAGGGTGANPNATFVLGSTSDPVNDHAFRIVNRDARSHDVTATYTLSGSGGEASGPASLTFQFFHDEGGDDSVAGDQTATINENTGSNQDTLTGVASGEVVYVVVTVDTDGLSSTNDLSGTLNVSVA